MMKQFWTAKKMKSPEWNTCLLQSIRAIIGEIASYVSQMVFWYRFFRMGFSLRSPRQILYRYLLFHFQVYGQTVAFIGLDLSTARPRRRELETLLSLWRCLVSGGQPDWLLADDQASPWHHWRDTVWHSPRGSWLLLLLFFNDPPILAPLELVCLSATVLRCPPAA